MISNRALDEKVNDYTKRKSQQNQTLFKSQLSEADWLSSVKIVTGKYGRVSAKLETYLREWHNMLTLSKPLTAAWHILSNSVCLSTNESIHGIGSSDYFLETF